MNGLNGKTIKRLFSYTSRAGGFVALSLICAVFFSALSMSAPYLFGRAIDEVGTDVEGVIKNLLLTVIVIAAASVFQYILLRVNNRIAYDITKNLRDDAYSKIGRLPISYIDGTSAGYIQSMVINDCETVGDGLVLFLNQFVSGIVSIIVTLSIMLIINVKIALFVLLFTPVTFLVSYMIAGKSFKSFKAQSSKRSEQTSFISESVENFREIKGFGVSEKKVSDFSTINEEYRKISTHAVFLSSISNPSTRCVNALIYAGVALIGSFSAIGGALTVGQLSSLLAYANQFMKPFNDLSSVFTEMSDSMACITRVFEFLDAEELDEDLATENTVHEWALDTKFDIEFKDVTFSYVPGKPVLKNISFKVNAGNSFAIVGPTGCGKTTLINLLMRFYVPDSGDILINGRSIADIPRNELRRYIGFVAQDTWFKNGTIRENLKYGKPDGSDELMDAAAAKTGAKNFIRRLPNRYDEKIDNSRSDFSEGQKQLMSITRAMVSDPAIMVLDEATSSVDVLTEVRIQKAVSELLNGRTGIIIAHRLSTIIDCDKIVVIKDGVIEEIGSHTELINKGGFYSKLYESYTD